MQNTRTVLLAVLWGMLCFSLLLVVVYEMGWMEAGAFAGRAKSEYFISVVMELEALAGIPLAPRLFKWKKVERELKQKKQRALRCWGLIRLLILCLPMVVNTMLYYLFMNPAFGYLAIIHALCLMFVYPSLDRCVAETESEDE